MARALPTPNTIDPKGVPSLRWGIVGSGWIAARFARALNVRSTQRIAAIASRNPATAAALARDAGIDKVHPTPETLVSDPSVDVVYVATPHVTHCELALRAIAAGKHVLVPTSACLPVTSGTLQRVFPWSRPPHKAFAQTSSLASGREAVRGCAAEARLDSRCRVPPSRPRG